MHFKDDILNLKKTYGKFNGGKTVKITYPLKSISSINFNINKILSVGPRNEGELFLIRSLGFKWENIFGIDLLSYSKLIEVGDIHKSNYSNNFFDVVVCGWVLTYSNDYKKILNELIRITKHNGIISIGFTYIPEKDHQITNTQQVIDCVSTNISNVLFNTDSMGFDKNKKRHSIIIFQVKKN